MKVSPNEPFELVYSLFQHEYLGYLFESFVVQLDEKGRLSFKHQNISSKNADEFAAGLDARDYQLIELMDQIQQDPIAHKFMRKRLTASEFFLRTYSSDRGDQSLQDLIAQHVESRKQDILPLLDGKRIFIMGNDGEPAWQEVRFEPEAAHVRFSLNRGPEETHYSMQMRLGEQIIDHRQGDPIIVAFDPAWLIAGAVLYHFDGPLEGAKLKPFLDKPFIRIPRKVEDTYFRKFVAPLVEHYDVTALGLRIETEAPNRHAQLIFSEVEAGVPVDLFGETNVAVADDDEDNESKLLFELVFAYGEYNFRTTNGTSASVKVEKEGDSYVFHKVQRDLEWEKSLVKQLREWGLEVRGLRVVLPTGKAFSWLERYRDSLEEAGISLLQREKGGRRYFMGHSSIDMEVQEAGDWFDLKAVVRFGPYEIPFLQLRDLIMARKREFTLPNGEIAVIPDAWLSQYGELLALSEKEDGQGLRLKKHHLALVQELETGSLARVSMDQKLTQLRDFQHIEETPLPVGFKGTLRPYQKAGYNWMQFLARYGFGGCLADDMGLGKTIQTLALLQSQKEQGFVNASLLILPTSLLYNWEKEAEKFAPDLKVFLYTGTYREKNIEQFEGYDVVITSYGIARLDIELLTGYYFNYVILDEAQAIKNPSSNIAQAVKQLRCRQRLTLTGTPIENSTLDLWSQADFLNPGLLGDQKFFRRHFQVPIEKHQSAERSGRLHTMMRPFLMRRTKSQVVTELPPKVEQIRYVDMTEAQAELYEQTKSQYRNLILDEIEQRGLGGSQILILQGLSKLRQIANHPRMVEAEYKGDSGKLDEVMGMLEEAIESGHKILIFSQFVKHLFLLKEQLDKLGMEYAYLDGSTKARQRQVELFQNDERVRVFLISLKAGGLGLNLTAADYVFLLDPWWNPAIEAQAVDRAHRIGQTQQVYTYKFISKGTVEEKILKLQDRKKKLAEDLISIEENFVKSLSREDIMELLG